MLLSDGMVAYAEPLAVMHAACFERSWSVSDFQSLLGLPTTIGWITDTSFLVCSHVLDEMEILTIGVLPFARHRGIASSLLSQLFIYAADRRVRRIFLEVAVNNTPALSLYQKAGFRQTGCRRGYYQMSGKTVDALCLTKDIPSGS